MIFHWALYHSMVHYFE